jgi:hypothetical protein
VSFGVVAFSVETVIPECSSELLNGNSDVRTFYPFLLKKTLLRGNGGTHF